MSAACWEPSGCRVAYGFSAIGLLPDMPRSPEVLIMSDFKKSQEAAFRKCVRDAIKQSKELTRCQKDIVLYVTNLWLHHRNTPEAVIRPGRDRIAKKTNSSTRSVSTVLSMMRTGGVLVPVANESGGNGPTRYKMRLKKLFGFCGHQMPEFMRGELVEISDRDPCKNSTLTLANLHGSPF